MSDLNIILLFISLFVALGAMWICVILLRASKKNEFAESESGDIGGKNGK